MRVGGLNRWKGKWKREEETEIEAKWEEKKTRCRGLIEYEANRKE